MSVIISQEDILKKLRKAISPKLKYQYGGEIVEMARIDSLSNWEFYNERIQIGCNSFRCKVNARTKLTGEVESYYRFETVNASFTIDEEGNVTINEPLILVETGI